MGGLLPELFSNEEATTKGQVDVTSPAFSLTKVQAGLGAIVVAIGGAAAKLEGPTAVKVAAIGGAALVMLGVFGLAAVDLITRQRAAQAKLQWPAADDDAAPDPPPSGGGGPVTLVADTDDLILQKKHSDDEYEVRFAELDGDQVTLVARRNGETLATTFKRP